MGITIEAFTQTNMNINCVKMKLSKRGTDFDGEHFSDTTPATLGANATANNVNDLMSLLIYLLTLAFSVMTITTKDTLDY